MAEFTLVLKNTTASEVLVLNLGQNIPPGTNSDVLTLFNFAELAGSDDLKALILAGTIVVNDGISDLTKSDAIDFLTRAHKKYVDDLDALQQTELDATQLGTGLNADGTFTTDVTTNYLTAATSLKDATKRLDTQLKTTDTLAAGAVTTNTAQQTEIDAIETAVGLNTTGTFSTFTGTNYLNASTTIKNAVTLLDTQLKTTDTLAAGAVTTNTAQQTEIDAIETGVGLNTNGTFTADATTNYLTTATSLKDATKRLDTQLKTTTDLVATEISNRMAADNLKLNLSGGTMTGEIFSSLNPTTANSLTRRDYVDTIASGFRPKAEVRVATTVALPAVVYNNGTSGVGATLTATTDGVLPIVDGITLIVGDSILVKNQVAGLQNGVYVVTQIGAVALPFILTRRTDFDSSGTGETATGSRFYIRSGTVNTGAAFTVLGTVGTNLILGTDNVNFGQTGGDTSGIVQAEIDTIETSVGLNSNGTLAAYTGTNYLNAATTIKQATTLLDTQLKTTDTLANTANTTANTANTTANGVVTTNTAQQTEIDAIETGAGLNTNGTFSAYTGTNYINSATNIKNAANLLDTQLKTTTDLIVANNNMTVINGIIYGRDTVRNKQIGAATNYVFSASGNASNKYLSSGATITTASGVAITDNMCLTSISARISASAKNSVNILIYKNAVNTAIATLTISAATMGAYVNNLNVDLVEGDYLRVYLSGSPVANLIVSVTTKYRA